VRTVHFVVPDSIDDPTRPSGGNIYDREVCVGLPAFGWTVSRHGVAGTLDGVLDGLPDGALVVVDGLLAGREPAAFSDAAGRLQLVLLLHMPAGLDGGDDMDAAIDAERKALSCAVAVIATSNWTRYVLIARHSDLADRVRVAHPGVEDAPLARGTADGAQLLYVGAVARHKGLDVLVRALAQVADLPWECVCVGSLDREPGYVAVVQRLLAQHGIGHRVRLVGAASRDVLAKYYAVADVLVAPSRVEAYGMVVTEALACGVPVLASDAGGIAEALGGASAGEQPGVVVRAGDVPAWAVAVRAWLTDAVLREQLSARAVLRRDTLRGWSATARRVSDVLAEVDE
jgi:glycosyltransferase involved in cell wall biosynthesis